MSFVAVAIGGGVAAGLGTGASIYGGMQQSKAAKRGSAAQQDALNLGIRTQQEGKQQALSYLDPFRQTGLNAGTTLESLMYSPQQRAQQRAAQQVQLQGDLEALQAKQLTFDQWHNQYGAQYTGGKGLKRSKSAHSQYTTNLNNQIKAVEGKLNTFNKQVAAEQQAEQQFGGQAQGIEASPWYQFQAQLLNRSQDRAFAARGLTGSGFEAEERRRGLIELGAGETERQFGRLKGLFDVGANASGVGAGIITGATQQIANAQTAIGGVQAQGYQNVAGANTNAATGVANSLTGAIGTGLNAMMFSNLIAANQGAAPTGGIRPTTGYGAQPQPTVETYGAGNNQYLINPPR